VFRLRCWVPKYQKWLDIKDTKCEKLIRREKLPGNPTIVEQPENHPFVYDVADDKWRDFYEQFQHHYLGEVISSCATKPGSFFGITVAE